MLNMENKVCLNHPDIDATSRCTSCFKPICNTCIINDAGEDFCTQVCAEKHKRTNETVQSYKERKKSSHLFRNLVILIILGTAAYWAVNNQEKVKDVIDKGKQELNK